MPEAVAVAVDDIENRQVNIKEKPQKVADNKKSDKSKSKKDKEKKRKREKDGDESSGSKKKEKKDKKKKSKENKEETASSKSDTADESVSASPRNTATAKEAQEFYEKHNISVTDDSASGKGGGEVFYPCIEFDQTGFDKKILKACKGFKNPTPIQAACWPIVLKGRDIVGIAETGSGKTFAFALPAMTHIMSKKDGKKAKPGKPFVLVVAPTRELAMQTHEQCEIAGKHVGVTSICIYGGVPKYEQVRALKSGAAIVIATPGRLVDLINDGSCDLSEVSYLVLDEADRMLDQGFEQEIRNIIGMTKPSNKRQTLMFSATWPESIRKLSGDFLKNPMKVTIGSDELAVNQRVDQIVEVVEPFDKDAKLLQLLNKYHKTRRNKVLVFVLYKKEAGRVEGFLRKQGFRCEAIHGDKTQDQRTKALSQFKDGTIPLLIATDVAARGLDIPNVEYVINYTFPLTIDEYIHRIGRTGRAGKKGVSHTLFTFHDKSHSGELVNVLKTANMNVPESLLKFGTTVKKKEHKAYGAFFKDIDPKAKATKIVFDD
ncbi:RNA-dependent ATPase [Mycoemilia scoparia]|uniref:RNA helicase n=1 Tax=Mycoemilia scoparia TaxID=417184 RepID=A0A9W8A170_9FUNG|nr:RNA-dependent ATPase [Mycoemilia scoparia]